MVIVGSGMRVKANVEDMVSLDMKGEMNILIDLFGI